MGWVQRFVRRLAVRAAKYAGIPLRDPALVAMLGNQPTASGVDVDENVAMNHAAVWQAVNIISGNVAAMPAVPYMRAGRDRVEATHHPSYELLLHSPNERMTPFTLTETMQAHALTWGNGYARIKREVPNPDAPVRSLDLLMPNQMAPERAQDGSLYYRFQAMYPDEVDEDLEPWEVLHIAGIGFDGLKGYPVVQQARESIGLGVAMEKYGAAFFGRGSVPGGLLEIPDEMTMSQQARDNLRETFELLHRGPDNAHRVGVVEHGITYKPLGLPPEVAQFLQSRTFQICEIARWFNIPPHLLRDLTHATFSNIEHQGIDFLVYTLRPWLIRWQQEYLRKLFSKQERRQYCVEHDAHSLLLTDIAARYTAYNMGRNGGWLTLNDILRREKLPQLPPALGDSRLVPANMRMLAPDGSDSLPPHETSIQDRAITGPQMQSLLDIVQAVANGTLDPDSAAQMVGLAFPEVPQQRVADIFRPYLEKPHEQLGAATQPA